MITERRLRAICAISLSISIGILILVVVAGCSSGAAGHSTAAAPSSTAPDTTYFNIPSTIPAPTPTAAPTPADTPTETPTPSDTVTSVAMQLQARTDGNGFAVITWSDTSGGGIEQATNVQGSAWRKNVPDGIYIVSAQGNGSGSWVEVSRQQIINGKLDGPPFDKARSTGAYAVAQTP